MNPVVSLMRSEVLATERRTLKGMTNLRDRFDSRKAVTHRGAVLPVRRFRLCGPAFQEDRFYLESAEREARRLVDDFGMERSARIFDLGCGTGRLATGILSIVGEAEHYRGLDVLAPRIWWCQRFITRLHPGFVFVHADVRSDRYNPRGRPLGDTFRLPFADSEFDIAYAYSVFSHMPVDQFRIHLEELSRILRPRGKMFFTSFAEENVPEVSVNPSGYRRDWGGSPYHCVRYDRTYLSRLLTSAGFAVERFDYETETDGQSAIYAIKTGVATGTGVGGALQAPD